MIAEDYFKRFAAALKGLIGGRIVAYESLLERGRREAIVRMKEQARQLGATQVVNMRFETASLSEDFSGQRPMFSAEFIAYGTALVPAIDARRAKTARRGRAAGRSLPARRAERSVDLAANLAAREADDGRTRCRTRVHVRVRSAGTNGREQLGELAAADALSRRADDVGWHRSSP